MSRVTPGSSSHVIAQQPLSAGACFALRDDFAHSTFLEKPRPTRAPTTHSTQEGLACSAQAPRPSAAHEIAAGPWRAAITHKPPCQEQVSPLTWVRRHWFKRWACPLPAAWRVALQRAFQSPARGKGEVKTPSEPPEMADEGRNDLGEGRSHHSKLARPHAGLMCSRNHRSRSPHPALPGSCWQPDLQEHGRGHRHAGYSGRFTLRHMQVCSGTGPGFLYLVR